MKVKELIEDLQRRNPEAEVLIMTDNTYVGPWEYVPSLEILRIVPEFSVGMAEDFEEIWLTPHIECDGRLIIEEGDEYERELREMRENPEVYAAVINENDP